METHSHPEQRLRRTGLAFFGRITAGISHDISNVLSTMGELSGLLQDFIAAGKEGGRIPPEKLRRLAEGLTVQVQKGAVIVRRLSRFAHSADDAAKTIDLTEQLEAIVHLAQRFAALKQVSLETDLTFGPLSLSTDPFLFQQAVFLCIDTALLSGDRSGPVVISGCGRETAAEIVVAARSIAMSAELNSRLSLLSLLMRELGGTAEHHQHEDGTHRLVLTIPRNGPMGALDGSP